MDKLFPRMYDCPESKQIAQGILYWFFYIMLLPFLFLFVLASGEISDSLMVGVNAVYFLINGVAVFGIFRQYLMDSFWNVRLYKSRFFQSVGLGLLVFFVVEFLVITIEAVLSGTVNTIPLPAADAIFGGYGFVLLYASPIFMGLCLLTIVPVTMSCLYYAVGFASPCQNKIWLGYLVAALVAAVPVILQITSGMMSIDEALLYYIQMLPLHMCACWVYQRSDTVWGAIAFQSAANLLGILFTPWLIYLEAVTEFAAMH
ncbi:MAG: hypothetical protein IIW51_02995 [Peptococcaceae bacterium]|nr:hypothetical protein [Peptococcaceae bacterium]